MSWRIENGKFPAKMNTVRGLCWFYGAGPETTNALTRLAGAGDEHGWWESHGDAVPDWFQLYVGLEAAATEIRSYNPELVHGLLQTPDYMRAVLRAADPQTSEQQIERLVSLRLNRQISYYDREEPARIVAVLGEGALPREVGSPAVMAEQRAHLASVGRRVRVEIRVLPWSAGAHAVIAGAFTVLDFADPTTGRGLRRVPYGRSLPGACSKAGGVPPSLPADPPAVGLDRGAPAMKPGTPLVHLQPQRRQRRRVRRVPRHAGHAEVRDSRDRTGPTLMFSTAQWGTFTTALQTGALPH
ncbi:DUF397 domain-containing protein [Micromonospora sp. LOL_015]|uniref:DUF397 domain-containing protein n=3 Tax=Micromonospora TaxID=1873 RepID=UPI003A871C19